MTGPVLSSTGALRPPGLDAVRLRGRQAPIEELSTLVAAAQEPGGRLSTTFGRTGQHRNGDLICYGRLAVTSGQTGAWLRCGSGSR
jgi:hypothetical protein